MRQNVIVLPQFFVERSTATTLEAAADQLFARWAGDERDSPGSLDDGVSPLDHRYDWQSRHPVPDYGKSAPRCHLEFESFFRHRPDIDVIQATSTVMPPAAARAYLRALWRDPEHPFVAAHTYPSIKLNGSVGYFTVGGPALAVPIHDPEAKNPPRKRSNRATMPPPGWPIEGKTRFEIEAENPNGVRDADLEWAASRHASLGPHDILVGDVCLREVERVDGLLEQRQTPGLGARPMVKVSGPRGVVGYFDDVEAATAALHGHIEEVQSDDADFLEPLQPYDRFYDSYELDACLVEDGKEVRGKAGVRMTRVRAAAYSEIATVKPGARREITGFMVSWHAADWHRKPWLAEVDTSGEGPRYRAPGSDHYPW